MLKISLLNFLFGSVFLLKFQFVLLCDISFTFPHKSGILTICICKKFSAGKIYGIKLVDRQHFLN